MPYITVMQTPRAHQVTLEEILRGEVDLTLFRPIPNVTGTVTRFKENIDQAYVQKADVWGMILALKAFNEKHAELFKVERHTLYRHFKIPKRSGGLRDINAPVESLMSALRELKELFEQKMFALYHTSAYAYVPGRSTIDAIRKHQQNESKWFEKTDFSDFFRFYHEAFCAPHAEHDLPI